MKTTLRILGTANVLIVFCGIIPVIAIVGAFVVHETVVYGWFPIVWFVCLVLQIAVFDDME